MDDVFHSRKVIRALVLTAGYSCLLLCKLNNLTSGAHKRIIQVFGDFYLKRLVCAAYYYTRYRNKENNKKEWKTEIPLAERGFDPRTSGLWAQHVSTAPLCYRRSRGVLPSFLKRSCHCLCKAIVDRKCQDSFNSFAPRLKKIVR